jgi:hypothetical protein
MVAQFDIRPLTSRKRAHIEEQRIRDVAAAFERLHSALDNMARPAWGRTTPDRLAYLQARFDRRVADPGARRAAEVLIEEWRQRSITGAPKPSPEAPVNDWTDGQLMAALSVRCGREAAPISADSPRPVKPARALHKPPRVKKVGRPLAQSQQAASESEASGL